MTVCEILKEARERTGFSMRDVAGFIGKRHQTVYFSEKNVQWIASDGIVLRGLCNVYAIDFEPLFEQLKAEKLVAPKLERKRYPR